MSVPLVPPLPAGIPPAGTPTRHPKDTPEAIADAARQFEALLIAQMLKSAREASEEADSTASCLNEIAEQQFAGLLAANGGLGLAKLVAAHLTPPADK